MQIETKFNIGQYVRRIGTSDKGEVVEINIEVNADNDLTIIYEVHHSKYENSHVGVDFGGHGYESEFEEWKPRLNASIRE